MPDDPRTADDAAAVPRPVDPLEQLARLEVPPMPPAQTFTTGVRRKLHPRLLALHVLQFAFGATAWAAVHMASALGAAFRYTLTGTWPERRRRR